MHGDRRKWRPWLCLHHGEIIAVQDEPPYRVDYKCRKCNKRFSVDGTDPVPPMPEKRP